MRLPKGLHHLRVFPNACPEEGVHVVFDSLGNLACRLEADLTAMLATAGVLAAVSRQVGGQALADHLPTGLQIFDRPNHLNVVRVDDQEALEL